MLNHVIINEEMLQWEDYFIKPYYEKEEYKRVLALLKKSGIFSGDKG
jgi:membrane-bound acyltransferase YfiQ involved in biofilm formation